MEANLKYFFKVANISGIMKVKYRGKVINKKSRGITTSSLFPLGSISKLYYAILCAKLEERGRINLNTPIVKYHKSFPNYITIMDLIVHFSGIQEVKTHPEFDVRHQHNTKYYVYFTIKHKLFDNEYYGKYHYTTTNYLI